MKNAQTAKRNAHGQSEDREGSDKRDLQKSSDGARPGRGFGSRRFVGIGNDFFEERHGKNGKAKEAKEEPEQRPMAWQRRAGIGTEEVCRPRTVEGGDTGVEEQADVRGVGKDDVFVGKVIAGGQQVCGRFAHPFGLPAAADDQGMRGQSAKLVIGNHLRRKIGRRVHGRGRDGDDASDWEMRGGAKGDGSAEGMADEEGAVEEDGVAVIQVFNERVDAGLRASVGKGARRTALTRQIG